MDKKKLYRSRTCRVIAGVCAGLGNYFDIDPVIVRALFVVAALGGGFGFLIYIVLWAVIPEEPGSEKEVTTSVQDDKKEKKNDAGEGERRNLGAVVLIVFGVIFFINNFMPHWDMHRLWPVLLITIGIVLLVSEFQS